MSAARAVREPVTKVRNGAPSDDSQLTDPENVAHAVLFALGQPQGYEVRERSVGHAEEGFRP